jgi:hypothetical protein
MFNVNNTVNNQRYLCIFGREEVELARGLNESTLTADVFVIGVGPWTEDDVPWNPRSRPKK